MDVGAKRNNNRLKSIMGKKRSNLRPYQDKRAGAEVGIHKCVGGAVSGDDDGIGELDAETGGYDGVGCMGQVISIYPYVPLITLQRYLPP